MSKYFNIMLVSFCLLLFPINYGIVFFIPMAMFYSLNNKKNLFLIVPISTITIIFLNRVLLVIYLAFIVSLIIYVLLFKTKNLICNSIFVLLFGILGFLLTIELNTKTLLISGILSITSTLLYLFFEYNKEYKEKYKLKISSFTYIEGLLAIISIIGSSYINISNINLGVVIAIFYSMYFSSNSLPGISALTSCITMSYFVFYLKIEYAIIIPFISSFYLFPKMYGLIILISFSLLSIYIKNETFPLSLLITTCSLGIFFELFKIVLTNIDYDETTITKKVYESQLQNVNNEVLAFSTFLDNFSESFSTPKEFALKINEGITQLKKNYCDSCYHNKGCLTKFKNKQNTFFKDIIIHASRSDYKMTKEMTSFYQQCPYLVEIRKSSQLINQRLNLTSSYNKLNTLVYQINGISNILRQYTIDNVTKNEIDYEKFYTLKKYLCDSGLNICYFEVKNSLKNNFQIEVGLRNTPYNDCKQKIESISSRVLGLDTSTVVTKYKVPKTYINIVPKINYDVTYGYGKYSTDDLGICGDNYLIKTLQNSNLLAVISDGMGKGYNANVISNDTLKLIDMISNIPMSIDTALQIINTFYYLQEYLEKYATLDLLQIDRNTGNALFYKMGASTSYIFHKDGKLTKVENESLPFGLEEVLESKTVQLQNDDLIIMTSDGIFENIINEDELEQFILQIRHLSPQKIAYEVLNYTRTSRKKTPDDMSIITLKIVLT